MVTLNRCFGNLLVSCGLAVLPSAVALAGNEPGACLTDGNGFQSIEGGCFVESAGLVYGYAPRTTVSFAEANAYCAEPSEGYSDWRLPSRSELLALSDEAANGPVPMALMSRPGFYWTDASSANRAWAVALPTGDLIAPEESSESKYSIVCVRAAADMDRDGVLDSKDECSWPNKADFGLSASQGVDEKGCLPGEMRVSASSAKASQCRVSDSLFRSQNGGCVYVPKNLVLSAVSPDALTYQQALTYCQTMKFSADRKWRLAQAAELAEMSGASGALSHLYMTGDATLFWSNETQDLPEEILGNTWVRTRVVAISVNLKNGERLKSPLAYYDRPTNVSSWTSKYQPEPAASTTSRHAVCVLDR